MKKMKKIALLIIVTFAAMAASAQTSTQNYIYRLGVFGSQSPATAIVNLDRESAQAVSSTPSVSKVSGYRICIYSSSGQNARSEGAGVLGRFRGLYGLSSEMTYNAPDFKIHVGYFLKRSEASMALGSIKSSFPTAFIVPTSLPISIFTHTEEINDPVAVE